MLGTRRFCIYFNATVTQPMWCIDTWEVHMGLRNGFDLMSNTRIGGGGADSVPPVFQRDFSKKWTNGFNGLNFKRCHPALLFFGHTC